MLAAMVLRLGDHIAAVVAELFDPVGCVDLGQQVGEVLTFQVAQQPAGDVVDVFP